jgi:hypothetical protein
MSEKMETSVADIARVEIEMSEDYDVDATMRERDAIIEGLTKDLEEARLQDSNQWRREYWKHYNDLKARADSLAAELAKVKQERDEAQVWRDQFDCCMCGSTMDSHDIGSGHSPVSMYDYERHSLAAELTKAREALERAGRALDMAAGFAERGQYPISAFEYRKAASDARAALPATPEPQPTKEN